MERRGEDISLLESRSALPALVGLIKQCLHNDPQQRPNTEDLLTRLQGMKVEVEGEYGNSHPIRLDLVRMRLAKEARRKDRRIEELTQELVQLQISITLLCTNPQFHRKDSLKTMQG